MKYLGVIGILVRLPIASLGEVVGNASPEQPDSDFEVPALPEHQPGPAYDVVEKILENRSPASEVRRLAAPYRQEVIRRLREEVRTRGAFYPLIVGEKQAIELLIQLVDRPTLAELAARYRTENAWFWYDFSLVCEHAREPRIIPYIADQLYLDEGAEESLVGSDNLVEGKRSMATVDIILDLLRHSKDLPAAVRMWSERVQKILDRETRRERVRKWWKLNENGFRAEQWSQLAPGE